MKPINKEQFCKDVHDFIKEHINEIQDSYSDLGFKDSEDMLNQILNDYEIATWAFTELLFWGLKENYLRKFRIYETDDYYVTKLNNHYYLYDWNNFYEAEKKTKVIEVWE